jgi:hypothetical protein
MNPPQNVTIRYIHDLLHHGSNHDFNIEEVSRHPNIVEGIIVGQYFNVRLSCCEGSWTFPGATVAEATKRVLEKFNVTFRQ